MAAPLYDALRVAFEVIVDPFSLVLLLLATLLGVIMGMLPGLGGIVTLALLIPITFNMDPMVAFMLLVAANGDTSQGGAVTAVLMNVPEKASNTATLLDDYPLARQGEAGRALGVSLTASSLGAIVGVSVLLLSIPVLIEIVLLFGAPEVFWLAIWGLTVIALVVGNRLITGLISAGLGRIFAMHGVSDTTAGVRWVFGSVPP